MDRKMIFFDIDGTLLTPPPDHFVPESAIEAVHMAQKNGHYTFINSGRTLFFIPEQIKNIGFDGFVCGCGTHVYFHNETLFSYTIPHALCKEIILLLRKCRIRAFFEENSAILFDTQSPVYCQEQETLRLRSNGSDLGNIENNSSLHFDKFMVFMDDNCDRTSFFNFIKDQFEYISHEENVGEVIPRQFSKATGIQLLTEKLSIPLENCYVIGDSPNDLPMLKYVPNSIAMGNSNKEILPYCSYQTTDILDDGIYHALEHFHLI